MATGKRSSNDRQGELEKRGGKRASGARPNPFKAERRTVVLVAVGETMTELCPEWVTVATAPDPARPGGIRYFDINQPKALVRRGPGGFHAYVDDPPLTEMASLEAKIIGNYFDFQGVPPSPNVYCAPELSCLLGASQFCKGTSLAAAGPATVDFGLHGSGLGFRSDDPFLSLAEATAMFPPKSARLDLDAFKAETNQPGIVNGREAFRDFQNRNKNAILQLMGRPAVGGGRPVVVFGPRQCLDGWARALQGLPQRPEDEAAAVTGSLIGHWAIMVLEQQQTKRFTLVRPPFSTNFTHQPNPTFNWEIFDFKKMEGAK